MTRVLKWFSPLRLIKWVISSRKHQLVAGGILAVTAVIAVAVMLLADGTWYAGFETKSFWDWMQLLLIPLSIVIIGTLIQLSENRTDREIGKERVQQETLNSYLDSMGMLIVNGDLEEPRTVQVMRARTAATIRFLESADHRNAVFSFLRDADLIGRRETLTGNDDSNDAQNNGTKPIALLEGIDLMGADLRDATLYKADLTGAILWQANLRDASLSEANLTRANLTDAKGTTNVQLAQAFSLVGATMPDGTVIENEEQWQEFKAKYGGS